MAAQMAIETALRLNQNNTAGLRLHARLLEANGRQAEAIQAWQRLAEVGGMQVSDAQMYARIAMKLQEWDIVDNIANTHGAGSAAAWQNVLKAEMWEKRGNLAKAEEYFREAVINDRGNTSKAALAGFLIRHQDNTESRTEAFRILQTLSQDSGALGAWAAEIAIERRLVPNTKLDSWIAEARRRTPNSTRLWLACEKVNASRNPDQRALSAIRVYSRYRNADFQDRAAATRWLMQAGEPELASRLFNLDEVAKDKNLFATWLEALMLSGRRSSVLKSLDDKRSPLSKDEARLIEFSVLRQLKRTEDAERLFNEIMQSAKDNEQEQIKVLKFIFETGDDKFFEKGLHPLLENPTTAITAMKQLLPIVQRARDIRKTRRFNQLALKAGGAPGRTHLESEIVYSDLVEGREVNKENLQQLAKKNPQDLSLQLPWLLFLIQENNLVQAQAHVVECGKISNADPILAERLEMLKFIANNKIKSSKIPKMGKLSMQETNLLKRHFAKQAKKLSGAEPIEPRLEARATPVDNLEKLVSKDRQHLESERQTFQLADEAEILLSPKLKSIILEKRVKKLQKETFEERVAWQAWMLAIGEPELAQSLISKNEVARNTEAFSLWIQSLILQKKWKVVLDEVNKSNIPLPRYLTSIYKARALLETGKLEESQVAFNESLKLSQGNQEEFIWTLAYIGAYGDQEIFKTEAKEFLNQCKDKMAGFQALASQLRQSRDASRIRNIYLLASTIPGLADDLTIKDRLNYLSLLVGEHFDNEMVIKRSNSNPNNFLLRTTKAMALMKKGKHKEALETLEDCEPDVLVESLPPDLRAVTAAGIAGGGRLKEGFAVALSIPPMALLAQEAEFLAEQLQLAEKKHAQHAKEQTR